MLQPQQLALNSLSSGRISDFPLQELKIRDLYHIFYVLN